MATTSTKNDVLSAATAIVTSSKKLDENLAAFGKFFPNLNEEGLRQMAVAMANASSSAPIVSEPVAAKPTKPAKSSAKVVTSQVINEATPLEAIDLGVIDSKALLEAIAVPVEDVIVETAKSEKQKKTSKKVEEPRKVGRPTLLKVTTPEGQEYELVEAVQKIIGNRALSMPEVMEAFTKKGWKTNSHSDNFSQSIYLILNKKTDLFTKNVDLANRRNTTYQRTNIKQATPKAHAQVAPVVVKEVGKAPTGDEILKVIRKRFANTDFAVRDIAQVLGVEARAIAVNTRVLKEQNIIKTVGQKKINGTGPEVMFYTLA